MERQTTGHWLYYKTDWVGSFWNHKLEIHTCDKFQKGIREIFLSFQGGFSKMYGIYRKILHSDEGDFKILVKSGMFWKKFCGSFQGAP